MNDFNAFLDYIQTPEFIAMALQIITALTVIFKLSSEVRSLARKKQITTTEVRDTLLATIPVEIQRSVDKAVSQMVMPLRQDVNQIMPILKDFGKILALSQENTPESRVAILNVIQDMGKVVNIEELERARLAIQTQVQEAIQKKEDIQAVIEEVVKTNKPVE